MTIFYLTQDNNNHTHCGLSITMNQGKDNSVSSTPQPRHAMHNRWPRAESVDDFRNKLQAVRQRIHNACLRSGRLASDVRLLPVSKTMDEAHGLPGRV